MNEQFPIGGPRQPVYEALRNRGFVKQNFGDKHWTRADGLDAHIYGTGSRLRITKGQQDIADGPMAEILEMIDNATIRQQKEQA